MWAWELGGVWCGVVRCGVEWCRGGVRRGGVGKDGAGRGRVGLGGEGGVTRSDALSGVATSHQLGPTLLISANETLRKGVAPLCSSSTDAHLLNC